MYLGNETVFNSATEKKYCNGIINMIMLSYDQRMNIDTGLSLLKLEKLRIQQQ